MRDELIGKRRASGIVVVDVAPSKNSVKVILYRGRAQSLQEFGVLRISVARFDS